MSPSPIDRRIAELQRGLRGVSRRSRRRVLAETRDHLDALRDDQIERGLTAEAAECAAVAAFGAGDVLAGMPRSERHVERPAIVAIGSLIALLSAGSAGLDIPSIAPASAATVPSQSQCIALWNGRLSRNARAIARRYHPERGSVFAGQIADGATGKTTGGGCTVKLWLPIVVGPYQHAVRFGADAPTVEALRFSGPRAGRQRSPLQFANVTFAPDGSVVPGAPTTKWPTGCHLRANTAVTDVELLPGHVHLDANGTTTITPAEGRRVRVTIRNTGQRTVIAPIYSVEWLTSPNGAGERTKPITRPRLALGATTTVVVTSPPLTPKVRYIRATSAAVGCEDRIGDNSRLYTVRVH